MTNNNLFEGFWDSLVTKAKQGAYAAAGALGSGSAKGKLSASLLSDGMFQQWKEWAAKTGSDLNAQNFTQFLGKMGFSKDFAAVETAELNKFIGPGERAPTADDHLDAAATKAKQEREAGANPAPAPATKAKPERKPFPQSQAQQAASKTTANNAKIQQQKAMQQRMQDKKAAGPRAKQTRESLEEDVVQDAELRKFFDQLAKRALKSGEAKSAAQKTIEINRVSPAEPEAAPAPAPAPATTSGADPAAAPTQRKAFPGAKPATPAATKTTAPAATKAPTQSPPAQQPAPAPAPAPQPAPAPAAPTVIPPGSNIQLSDREKEIMSAFPAGTRLGTQVTATDPEVQELAQKVLQAAFDDYKKRTPVAAPKAKPKAAPKPAPAPAPAAPPAEPPATPAA